DIQAEQHERVRQNVQEIRLGEQPFEMLEADPFAAANALERLIILEGNDETVHRNVFENQEIQQPRKDHDVQPFVLVHPLEQTALRAWLPPRCPRLHDRFLHAHSSLPRSWPGGLPARRLRRQPLWTRSAANGDYFLYAALNSSMILSPPRFFQSSTAFSNPARSM